jgi:ribonuclease P protein component
LWPFFNALLIKKEDTMIFTESLKKNNDFRNVYENGKSFANKMLVVYVWENGSSMNRLGISCSKKIGNSVVRHRFARLVRESYRLHEDMFNSGLDIVVVARACAQDATYFDIEESLLSLAGKARIRKNGGI